MLSQILASIGSAGIGAEQIAAVIATLPPADRASLYRDAARESMAAYVTYLNLGIEPALHHRLLIAALQDVERGECDRLMVCMPPGSAKSFYTSRIFPAWFLGRNPDLNVIAASHTHDLAETFGRYVRNLFASNAHRAAFGVGVSPDNKAADRWSTEKGGEYFAIGVGGAVSGRRADVGIIDDPVKSREDADSDRGRERAWEWYVNDFKTRLKPEGRQVLVMCMAGDTAVLMSDGTEKELQSVRRGDMVATYEDGEISAAKVLNWKNQGHDFTREIRMTSGITVRANEKHPFLIAEDGELRWRQTKHLRPKDVFVRVMPHGAHGRESLVQRRAVKSLLGSRVFACPIIINKDGPKDTDHPPPARVLGERLVLSDTTELHWTNTTTWLPLSADYALSAERLPRTMRAPIGAESSALTTATRQERFGGCSATHATLLSDMAKRSECSLPPLGMFEIARDEIASVTPYGFEEVFDIQVERTENFIANGLVSHNTRWHEDDLGGRILMAEGDRWRVLKLPMEAVAGDPLGRRPGERLWPEWFTPEMVADAKGDVRVWNALYQQEPAGEDGDYFKRDWFRVADQRPHNLTIYGASDYAVTEGGGDFTEHGVFGVDAWSNIHIIDWWRGQTAPDEWIDAKCDLIVKHKPMCWFGESGPIRRAIEPFLMRRMEQRRAFCRLEWLPSIGDKPTRCRAFQALAASGKVFVPFVSPWKADVVGQLLRFPAGLHDDAVDVVSLIGRGLEYMPAPDIGERPRQTRAVVGNSSAKRYGRR